MFVALRRCSTCLRIGLVPLDKELKVSVVSSHVESKSLSSLKSERKIRLVYHVSTKAGEYRMLTPKEIRRHGLHILKVMSTCFPLLIIDPSYFLTM